MPIHSDYKSMVQNMKNQYCKGGSNSEEMKFADGSKISVCKKARSVFYATLRSKGWNETKPRSKTVEETVSWYLKRRGIK